MIHQEETNNFKLEYLNSFAAIFEDGFLFHQYNPKIPIHIEKLDRVLITKRKVVSYNWFLFLLAGFGAFVFYYYPMNSMSSAVFMIAYTVITLIMAFFLKSYRYTFLIIFKEGEIVRIKIEKKNLSDKKLILKQSQKAIKEYKKVNN